MPGGRAPAGAKIVAGDGEERIGALTPGVVADGDVVKGVGVIGAGADGVEGGIDETNVGLTAGYGFLVGERGEASPERRGATGAADAVAIAVGDDENIIGGHGNIGDIAHGGGPFVRHHADVGLIIRNGILGADATAAAGAVVVGTEFDVPVPNGFRGPCAAGARGAQSGAADLRDVGTVAREIYQAGVGVAVAGSVEKGLALGGHFLPDGVSSGLGRAADNIPGTTELLSEIVGGHLVENVLKRCAVWSDINHEICHRRGHREGDFDVEADFDVFVVIGGRGAGSAVNEDVIQRNIGKACEVSVVKNVNGVVAVEFDEGDGLAGAVKGGTRRVGSAKVVAEVSSI